MDTNYLGGSGACAFLPALEAAGGAHVVNVVSVAGTVAFAPAPVQASKHAQLCVLALRGRAAARSWHLGHTVLPASSRWRVAAVDAPEQARAAS